MDEKNKEKQAEEYHFKLKNEYLNAYVDEVEENGVKKYRARKNAEYKGNTRYTFTCPNCGYRMISETTVMNLAPAIAAYCSQYADVSAYEDLGLDDLASAIDPNIVSYCISTELVASGGRITISFWQMLRQMLTDLYIDYNETVMYRNIGIGKDPLSYLPEKTVTKEENDMRFALVDLIVARCGKMGINLGDSGSAAIKAFLDLCCQYPNLVVLDCVIRPHSDDGIVYSADVLTPNNQLLAIVYRSCPQLECGKKLSVFCGTREEVLVGLMGKSSAGKTTLLCALVSELQKLYTRYNIKVEMPTYDGDGGWNNFQKDFYNKYLQSGYPEKTKVGVKTHYSCRIDGWSYTPVKGMVKTGFLHKEEKVIRYDKKAESKVFMFLDVPGEFFNPNEDEKGARRLEIYNFLDFAWLCVTPGQLNPFIFLPREPQEIAQPGDEYLSEAQLQQRKLAEFNLTDMLNRITLDCPGSLLIVKGDLLRDVNPGFSTEILAPDESIENTLKDSAMVLPNQGVQVGGTTVLNPMQLYGMRTQIFTDVINQFGGYLYHNTPGLIDGCDKIFGKGKYGIFAVSTKNLGSDNIALVAPKGVFRPMLWLFNHYGLLPALKPVSGEGKGGYSMQWELDEKKG